MPFAQLVIGPPGAGKSTYCNGMHQFLGAIGRKCSIVNLDPANDKTSYPCALDVRDLVTLEEIMDEDKLGPNGATLYALEELEENYSWLEEGLKELGGLLIEPDAACAFADFVATQRIMSCSIAPVKLNSLRTMLHYGTSSFGFRNWATEFVAMPKFPANTANKSSQTAHSHPPCRLIYPYASFNVYFRPSPLPSRHAPTRPPPFERLDQDR
jgi:hypothetical protein